ncbi:MAG: MFS transporter, partial [Actinobacteria bacterium]|nr:MFS transporter [Actinomycetota bacterium]
MPEPGKARPPRRPLLLLAPATFFEGYDVFVLALALPLIRRDLGLTVGESGVLASAVLAGSFGVLAILPMADRWGRRPVLTATIVGYTTATFATAFSRGVLDFAAYQFVARVFLSAEYALATIVLVETARAAHRGRALGTLASMDALGRAAAGAGFLAVMALDASWRVLYLAGILPLALVAWARRHLPETAPRSGLPRARLRDVRGRWLAGSAILSATFATYATGVTALSSLLVFDEWGWTLEDLRPPYFGVWALGVTGFFVAGRLMDRWGRRPTAALFLAACAVSGFAAFTSEATAARVLGLGLVIFAITGATPCVAAFSTESFPVRTRGRVGAFFRATTIAGSTAAPALVGVLAG